MLMRPEEMTTDLQPTPPTPDELLLIGRIVTTFGLRGQLKMVPITAQIDHLKRKVKTLFIGPKRREFQLKALIVHKPSILILTLDGITTETAAEDLRSMEVFIREKDAAPLAADEYFMHQLYGLVVVTDTGEELGKVREVIETGANDVLVVARTSGGEALIPMIRDVVVNLDIAGGRITIHPLEGLL
jgi:16S rRNA processing protein RimM